MNFIECLVFMKILNKIPLSGSLLFSIVTVCLGSVLFGYNSAVISGAILFFSEHFHLSVFAQGEVVSSLVLGAVCGALLGGRVADIVGRRGGLFVSSFLFLIGTGLLVFGNFFITGRFIQGIGVGMVSLTVPLYLSEISPSKYRGRIVALNQLMIVFGVVLAFAVNYFYAIWSHIFWDYLD